MSNESPTTDLESEWEKLKLTIATNELGDALRSPNDPNRFQSALNNLLPFFPKQTPANREEGKAPPSPL